MASEDSSSGTKTVLVAIDGSDHSLHAFNWYLEHFHQDNHIIGLAHIYTLPDHRNFSKRHHGDALQALDCQQYEQDVKKAHQDHATLIKKYQNICTEKGLPNREFCREKKASIGEEICELAKENEVCCIVMGQRGIGVIERTLFGSVSEYVLHHAKTTVVLVPPKKK